MKQLVLLSMVALAASACRETKRPSVAGGAGNRVSSRMARLYFESPAMLLVAEPRNLQLPENPAAAIPIVVREELKGPVNPALTRSFPEDTVVRGAFYLPDGTAFVDLGGATLSNGWGAGSHQELMAAYSLVQTVTANFPEVKRVRLLVNGVTTETLGGHLALDRALHAEGSLVEPHSR